MSTFQKLYGCSQYSYFFLLQNTSIACFCFIKVSSFLLKQYSVIPSILCHKYIFGKFLSFCNGQCAIISCQEICRIVINNLLSFVV
jgi:hypothetical protein